MYVYIYMYTRVYTCSIYTHIDMYTYTCSLWIRTCACEPVGLPYSQYEEEEPARQRPRSRNSGTSLYQEESHPSETNPESSRFLRWIGGARVSDVSIRKHLPEPCYRTILYYMSVHGLTIADMASSYLICPRSVWQQVLSCHHVIIQQHSIVHHVKPQVCVISYCFIALHSIAHAVILHHTTVWRSWLCRVPLCDAGSHHTAAYHGISCHIVREFKDVVFEDVVFDNNSCVTLLSRVFIVTSMSNILL